MGDVRRLYLTLFGTGALTGGLWKPMSMEHLETRRLLDSTFARLTTRGTLDVDGTSGDDSIQVAAISPDQVRVSRNSDDKAFFNLFLVERVHIDGGNGNDNLTAGSGNDVEYGGPGDDQLNGGDGNDTLIGGPGFDAVNGGNGIDTCEGEVKALCEL